RDIYIGGTMDIGGDFLGEKFDYVALGHLHINQTVKANHVRYSGSPIPLSFSESKQKKKVNIVTFEDNNVEVEELEIPLYRSLKVIKGNLEEVKKELDNIEEKSTWIKIDLNDENPMFANQSIREYANELELTILAIKIDKTQKRLQAQELKVTSLDELNPTDVFNRRLEVDEITDEDFKKELTLKFKEVLERVVIK
ncbi:MAG TPA: exonuclease sbcCD subunit D, partial [Sulfurovum sp.]|nr:exonuclease sbcCD subunit D [Sulfurovum sp.]